jgi:hypothetical protein
MAKITVIRDPNIEQTPIVHALRQPGADEDPELVDKNPTEYQQTKIFGLIVPILALNRIAVDWTDVLSLAFDCTGKLPSVKFVIRDRSNLLSNFSDPGNDNELRLQILPRFDNTYKKIDLSFVCTEIKNNQGTIVGTAEYKLKDFTKSVYKALGQISTFELCDKISNETGLGFASNTQATDDSRFIQCQYESYKDVLDREILKSGSSEAHVYDWWVDVWNNVVLCDLYDRINSEDSEEDMMIWTDGDINNATIQTDPEPLKMPALYSNFVTFEHTDLYVLDYDVENNPATQSRGNAVTLSVYEESKKECINHYIGDGDILKNNFEKFEYAGEVYGDYNYLLAEKCRDIYLKKISSEVIVIHTTRPQLGIMRGDQLRFVWYDNDSEHAIKQNDLEDAGLIKNSEQLSTIIGWLKDFDIRDEASYMPLRINLQYSGQYTCIGQYITYNGSNQTWDCWMYLSRPARKRPKILNEPPE